MLRLACPSKPAVAGRSLKQRYFSGTCSTTAGPISYFEVDMDTSDSAAANRAISIAKPISKSIVFDLAFVIEGREEAELPEVLVGCARCVQMNLSDSATKLYSPSYLPSYSPSCLPSYSPTYATTDEPPPT
uniref:Protein ENHANCED DISEASE RESISTANCE 2 C-terminal domain-containing protein n=1 Tax=Haptolina brevifila TaxID=156173 RepID=A0A7S2N3F6_9EUKA|mmetsp:Transcript_65397/g.129455  ORF Transcript_65397/g.129455 Transcript_65397/m.129455 type:complete len:131 (+) Transcript_65397:107-499(+)